MDILATSVIQKAVEAYAELAKGGAGSGNRTNHPHRAHWQEGSESAHHMTHMLENHGWKEAR